jgi:hypothetical protein
MTMQRTLNSKGRNNSNKTNHLVPLLKILEAIFQIRIRKS